MKTLKSRLQVLPINRLIPQLSKPSKGMYDYKWQQSRIRFLTTNPLCLMCMAEGLVTAAAVVDHKIPHQGNQQLFRDESNWQALCKLHHDSHKQKQERNEGYR